ncbi:hypothetical protein L0Y47_08965 [Ectopseudomonas composti]
MVDFSFVPIITGVGGAVIGAWITVSRAKYAAYSSDFSKRVEHALSLISEKADCSCLFWLNPKDANKLKINSQYITGLRGSLVALIDAMDKDYKGFKKPELVNALFKFNEACTGGDFPQLTAEDGSKKISTILVTAETLKTEIFRARIKNYHWVMGF